MLWSNEVIRCCYRERHPSLVDTSGKHLYDCCNVRLVLHEGVKFHVPVASKVRVVPVSTMPAVVDKIEVEPNVTDWSIPQNSDAGDVLVMGLL